MTLTGLSKLARTWLSAFIIVSYGTLCSSFAVTIPLAPQGTATKTSIYISAGKHALLSSFDVTAFNGWITASNAVLIANGCPAQFVPVNALSTFTNQSSFNFFDIPDQETFDELRQYYPGFQFKVVHSITIDGADIAGRTDELPGLFRFLNLLSPSNHTAIRYTLLSGATLAHEWGHSRGLLDSNDPGRLMYKKEPPGSNLTWFDCFAFTHAN